MSETATTARVRVQVRWVCGNNACFHRGHTLYCGDTCGYCHQRGVTVACRVRAFHAPSGNVIVGDLAEVTGASPNRSVLVIPDGLLEAVVIREGAWVIADVV